MTDTTPIRIQRKRTKGWKMPPNTVYVGRPTKWGNIFNHKKVGKKKAASLFRKFMTKRLRQAERKELGINPMEWLYLCMIRNELEALAKKELRGKDLACWCRQGEPCHADVLLEIANR